MTAYQIIDAGGTFLKSAVLDPDGNVFEDSSFSIESASQGKNEEILQAFKETVEYGYRFIETNKLIHGGIGVAIPGPFDYKNATSLMKHKFQSIYGINLRNYFYLFAGIPRSLPVEFIQDANAVLIGEMWKGNAIAFKNAAVVTLGTGLGFAYSQNGIVQCNKLGGPETVIYNLPYKDGILEEYTAKKGILNLYIESTNRMNGKDLNVIDIARRADKGDITCKNVFSEVGKTLAVSIKDILAEKQIECLLFSGQISNAFHHLKETIHEELLELNHLRYISEVKSIDHSALWGALRNIQSKSLLSIDY